MRTRARVSLARLLLLPVAAAAAAPSGAAGRGGQSTRDLDARPCAAAAARRRQRAGARRVDGAALGGAPGRSRAPSICCSGPGARAAVANRYGVTPLSLAAANGNAAVVERLLKGGADPNTAWPGGETVLMTAARAGRTDVVRVLLEHGADVERARSDARSDRADVGGGRRARRRHPRAGRGRRRHRGRLARAGGDGPRRTTARRTARASTARAVPRLDAFTPLQFAVHAGQIEAARALLDAGASLADETPQGMGADHARDRQRALRAGGAARREGRGRERREGRVHAAASDRARAHAEHRPVPVARAHRPHDRPRARRRCCSRTAPTSMRARRRGSTTAIAAASA